MIQLKNLLINHSITMSYTTTLCNTFEKFDVLKIYSFDNLLQLFMLVD